MYLYAEMINVSLIVREALPVPTFTHLHDTMGDLTVRQKRNSNMEEYLQELPPMHLEPLWDRLSNMVPPIPNPASIPHLWEYKTVLPYLNRAGAMVPEQEAERRVLMLVNPSMRKFSPFLTQHITDDCF